MRILAVEDDRSTHLALQKILSGMCGYEVMLADTAPSAIKHLAFDDPYDLVLLDIHLGDGEMTGWAVAAYMLTEEKLRKVPIIVMSAMDPESIRRGARTYANVLINAALIIDKPVSVDRLLQAIDTLTSSKRP